MVGITKKKIMMNAWEVTITLYSWSSPNREPVLPNSNRIMDLSAVPINPDHTPNIKYKVPISLWLVENIQRCVHIFSGQYPGDFASVQRFTISYLTGKCFWNCNVYYKYNVLYCSASHRLVSISMILNFFVVYFAFGLTFSYFIDGRLFFVGPITMRASLDRYSTSFFSLLGVVSAAVGTWAYYYIGEESNYSRFIILLLGFILSIIGLIFFSNMYATFIRWDGLGVTSFLLVIYYSNRKRLGAGMITALTNRIGDCFFVCCLGLCLSSSTTLILFLLIALSITKRAQIPFRAWLPSAMAAPTPVRALVHSSTLVTAGVYLLIRYCDQETCLLIHIGTLTMLIAGLRACVESDLKKVVALSTLSQLGVMIVALGAQEKTYCFFHLISHACFKALLFICVGVSIHSVYGTQDYRRFRIMSPLYLNFFWAVAVTSLSGFIFTAGFFRKDLLLEVFYHNESYSCSICLFIVGVGLTACYSFQILISSVFAPTYASGGAGRLGGQRWMIKGPVTCLGVLRVGFGACVNSFVRPRTIVLYDVDKTMVLWFLGVGMLCGHFTARFYSPFYSGLAFLYPSTRQVSIAGYNLQKHSDLGWVNIISQSVGRVSLAFLQHPTSYIGIGLILVILFFLYA